ncbi:MAG: hypothetical protein ACOYK6_04910 [Chthoniobacterales bacterium]
MDIEREKPFDPELPLEEIRERLHAAGEHQEAVVETGELGEERITEVSPSPNLVEYRDAESSPEEEEETSSLKSTIRRLPYDFSHTLKQRTKRWAAGFSSWIASLYCFK